MTRMSASGATLLQAAASEAISAAWWDRLDLEARRPGEANVDLILGKAAELAFSPIARDQLMSLALMTGVRDTDGTKVLIETSVPPAERAVIAERVSDRGRTRPRTLTHWWPRSRSATRVIWTVTPGSTSCRSESGRTQRSRNYCGITRTFLPATTCGWQCSARSQSFSNASRHYPAACPGGLSPAGSIELLVEARDEGATQHRRFRGRPSKAALLRP